MRRYLTLILSVCFFISAQAQKIQSPSEFLGYKLGDQFTPHYRIIEYFKYIAQSSKNVKLQQYGSTNEGRPLVVAFIANDENINKLEDIRKNNLRLAGMESGTGSIAGPAVVWLSYNVHGNEPSSSEAAMLTLFTLVDPANAQSKEWLKNTVVVIDPCLNPDGRDRYVNFFNPVRSLAGDANPSSREHIEPWPGGRVNHYYFDLNRDWAWQTQKESQARVGLFNQWLPQIHVDYHEQFINNPYYFAPAAEPFHKVISKWQREFQTTIGKNNAKYFDKNAWMYFTKEEFDLLYPSYGDTYPLYNGSIGMTYEQAGHSMGGVAIVKSDGDTLTLADRIAHHFTTGLSTIETASANTTKLLTEYKKFFDSSISEPPGEYKGYVVKNDNLDNVKALAKLLDRNGIKYGFGGPKGLSGFNYFNNKTETFNVEPNDMVIDAHQPKAVLLNVLFEPKTFVADSNTYDITAWALPYAYGLKTYGLKLSVKPQFAKMTIDRDMDSPANPYAYVCEWKSMQDVQFLAALLKMNIKVRYSEKPFEEGGKQFGAGSLIIARTGNKQPNFDELVVRTAYQFGRPLNRLSSGFVDKGNDLGSSSIKYIGKPRILLASNDGVSSSSMGEVWQLFEQQIDYPVTVVRLQDLNRVKLSDFDVVIFPDGGYDNAPFDKLQNWIREGGKLIAINDATSSLVDKKGFLIKNKEEKKADKDDKKTTTDEVRPYDNRDRESLKSSIPGAIYKVNIDNTHPLGFGLPGFYYTLKLDDKLFEFLGNDDGWNVGTIDKDAYVAGFVGQKTKVKLTKGLLFGVQPLGRGSIVYMADDPLFRSFWENGKLLFSNAVFMVGK